ncbi:MAG: transcriptional regulator [Candidatus Pacearchaeota archaeon]
MVTPRQYIECRKKLERLASDNKIDLRSVDAIMIVGTREDEGKSKTNINDTTHDGFTNSALSTISTNLKKLRNKQYIIKEINEEDEREILVRLTEKGRELYEEIKRSLEGY